MLSLKFILPIIMLAGLTYAFYRVLKSFTDSLEK